MMENFQKYLEERALSENTIRSYLIAARGYLRWYEESFGAEMERMFRPNFLDYKSYLETVKRLSAESINAKVAGLACFNRFLIESGRQEQMAIDSRTDYLSVQTAYASPSIVGQQEVDAFRQAVLASGKAFCERDYACFNQLAQWADRQGGRDTSSSIYFFNQLLPGVESIIPAFIILDFLALAVDAKKFRHVLIIFFGVRVLFYLRLYDSEDLTWLVAFFHEPRLLQL